MFNKKEIETFRGILHENNLQLREELRGEWRQEMQGVFLQYGNDLKHEIREEMQALFVTFENKITTNIGELLDASVLPQIAELQKDMTLVKGRLQSV